MTQVQDHHKSGFVNIIGKPNVGKSTLMNAMVGEKLSIITSKAQTTRHRIMGIMNGPDFQLVYSDTPGILNPLYPLHQSMMNFVNSALEDADVLLFVSDLYEKYTEEDEAFLAKLKQREVPLFFVMNKIDLAKGSQAHDKADYWKEKLEPDAIFLVSALEGLGVAELLAAIIEKIPVHPPYFPKDEISDKPERFFVSEVIREKIFLHYKKEVPYSCEVAVETFEEEENIIRIRAIIMVERDSQKGIIIGHKGEPLKKVGTEARKDLEVFFGKKIFLEQYVKVEKDWRKDSRKLKRFGY